MSLNGIAFPMIMMEYHEGGGLNRDKDTNGDSSIQV